MFIDNKREKEKYMYFQTNYLTNDIRQISHLYMDFYLYYTKEYKHTTQISDSLIPSIFQKIFDNMYSCIPLDLFKGYSVHIWNNTREDIPEFIKNKVYFVDFDMKIITINVSLINIIIDYNSLNFVVAKIFALIFSKYIDFENNKLFMKIQWHKLRGNCFKDLKDKKLKTKELNLFIEDFAILFGNGINNYSEKMVSCQTEFVFSHAKSIKGLRDFLLIWKRTSNHLELNKKNTIFNLNLGFKKNDENYCCVTMNIKNKFDIFNKKIIFKKIDKINLYLYSNDISDWIETTL